MGLCIVGFSDLFGVDGRQACQRSKFPDRCRRLIVVWLARFKTIVSSIYVAENQEGFDSLVWIVLGVCFVLLFVSIALRSLVVGTRYKMTGAIAGWSLRWSPYARNVQADASYPSRYHYKDFALLVPSRAQVRCIYGNGCSQALDRQNQQAGTLRKEIPRQA